MKEKIYIVKEHICSGESEFTAAGKARIDVEDILYDWKAKDIKIKIKKNLNENSILKKLFSHYHLYQIKRRRCINYTVSTTRRIYICISFVKEFKEEKY